MPVPEGEEWLDEAQEEWETPVDLQSPTRYAEANLAIKLLSCEFLGHEVRVALGRFISEYSLYTVWFHREVKRSGFSVKETTFLLGLPSEQTRIVYEAWKMLEVVDVLNAPNDVVRERRVTAAAALTAALQSAAGKLMDVRKRESQTG